MQQNGQNKAVAIVSSGQKKNCFLIHFCSIKNWQKELLVSLKASNFVTSYRFRYFFKNIKVTDTEKVTTVVTKLISYYRHLFKLN